ncbi:thioredoxin family protein [Candidatus Fokinia crypta]|uniref:AhpC/TSA thioredoxin family protein n=1 Tax=Candidatus Fokinia crypta TaxID=1920990 RepID=A0ABZ0US65_9RICK|nr:thioredoxin family protein [Candidatus Fokinia cryptica]WPX98101.1 Putative AhpC/TSA thioredoxin family protein [Candidatus Fokinia cryptica]
MAITSSTILSSQIAYDFVLPSTDGKIYELDDIALRKGFVIAFICNHCPYVKSIIEKLVTLSKDLADIDIGFVGINSNDETEYPEDSFEMMKKFVEEHSINFPYLHDQSQEVAKKYGAVCTPDFFGYNSDKMLVYKGRLDASQKNNIHDAERELFNAMWEVAQSGNFTGTQNASIGCSIKWKKSA